MEIIALVYIYLQACTVVYPSLYLLILLLLKKIQIQNNSEMGKLVYGWGWGSVGKLKVYFELHLYTGG